MIDVIAHGSIRELNLARAPVNALDQDLLVALRADIEGAARDGAAGIVLSGLPGVFSAGVDIPALLVRDRAGVRAYWREFFATCAALARAPMPIVAAVTGHAPAGGAVLALFCDYRVMAAGSYRIGLNEVRVGLSVPECIQLAMRRVIGRHRTERLLVAGDMLEPDAAAACGLVDELAAPDQVVARAAQWLEALLALPRRAMLATRAEARRDLAAAYADPDALPLDAFTDAFLHPDTQAVLAEWMAARAKKK